MPFAIGSETLGSIVSPSVRCGTTALRPTFGRVSRHGAMTLCWSMDKLGPMARSAQDCAIVMAVIQGPDGRDASVRDVPFVWPGPVDISDTVVGYPRGAFGDAPLEHPTLRELAALGLKLVEVELPRLPSDAVGVILAVEAATAFDDFTRSGLDDQLVQQGPGAWPNLFRAARTIPAVEFLRAQRVRARLMAELHEVLAACDVLVHPPYHGDLLGITNVTGHPTLIAPAGMRERDGRSRPEMVCFTGQLDDDVRLLLLVDRWQRSTPWEEEHPAMEWLER